MNFICNDCKREHPNFKSLIDHYREAHNGKLKRLAIWNKKQKQTALIYATSAEEAMQSLLWNARDCTVKELN